MPIVGNAIDNNALASLTRRAGPEVTSAIQKASLKTGVDFAYLMQKASTESSFDTDAQARSSSARGLYQFIGSTWIQMINRYGDKYGLGEYADKISDNGKVTDAATRREILALRDDPEIAALMAGEFAAENKQTLIRSGIKEKDIGATELYLAHFMGAGAASQFIKGMKKNPLMAAADIFPAAAKANHNIFYSKTQKVRSFGEIYAMFDKKFGDLPTGTATSTTEIASAQTKPVESYARNSILRIAPAENDSAATTMAAWTGDTAETEFDLSAFYGLNRNTATPLGAIRGMATSDVLMMAHTSSLPSGNDSVESAKERQGLAARLAHNIAQAVHGDWLND